MTIPRVRIIHETNPQKYFPAIWELERRGRITIVGAHRYSVIKEALRGSLIDRRPLRDSLSNAWSDIFLRLRLPWIHGEVIVLGFAPWEWRILLYGGLARSNTVVYHTSWHQWGTTSVPRTYGVLTGVMRKKWESFLVDPAVKIVAVLRESAQQIRAEFNVDVTVIPHAVSDAFFTPRAEEREPGGPLRLIYVGELSEKKGVPQLLSLMRTLSELPLELTFVGSGPLASVCERAALRDSRITCAGRISSREQLAQELKRHDVLCALSQRVEDWEELFGIVAIEALATGLGVLASEHIGPRSILAGVRLGNLFADDDAEGVAALLTSLSTDPAKRADFIAAHRGLADDFRIQKVADQWALILGSHRVEGDAT